MNKDFDKIISDKIKATLDNQNVPYNVEHWKMLLAKKEKNKKKGFIFWRVAAILVFLLVAGGYIHFFNTTSNFEKSAEPQLILDTKTDSLKSDSLNLKKGIYITSSIKDTTNKKNDKYKKSDKLLKSTSKQINSINTFIGKNKIATNKPKFENSIKTYASTLDELMDTLSIKSDAIFESSLILEKRESIIVQQDSVVAKNEFLVALESLKNIEEEQDKKDSNKNIKIGLGVAPIFNYTSENNNSTTGLAGGFSIDYAISNKFEISTGILYSSQKFDLNKGSNYLKDAVSRSNSSQLTEKNATFEGVEIPINIKYNFSVDDKNIFVSVGFSSTSSFNENTESKYILNSTTQTKTKDALGNNIVKYELYQVDKTILTPNTSNVFNFANIINASLGIDIPTKNNQSIIIEPYLKYYVSPVSQQKVDVLGAGIHLRYIFIFKKNI
ncbi:outer membrane beta-barrel protein [Lutibacter sp.]|uniref:outer membrane beta-barrel protein n=1 Tax=Lutibacter sp. TaxID=1925666 RepID=UPI001A1DA2CF|nr:outer membrane beta-barrel protein [Lutibacter sp.]MBI9042284.1 outer membrane beta-barrel protein [Lutibacter sp.]